MNSDLLVGLVALALLPLIAMRIVRGLRQGQLPVYRSRLSREAEAGKFNALLILHVLSFIIVALVAADLLFGLGLKERL
jgi:hypothetical protein